MDKKTALIAGGAGITAAVGLALAGASLANAEPQSATTATYGAPGYGQAPTGRYGQAPKGNGNTDPSKPMRSDEKLLSGDTDAKVTAAAKAKEPGATIQRVETDSDGVYEAHMVRADGTMITVQVGADFKVTNVIVGGPGGAGHGGPGGGKPTGSPPSGSPQAPPSGSAEAPPSGSPTT